MANKISITYLPRHILAQIEAHATGSIGGGPGERAFCGLAHQHTRNPDSAHAQNWQQCHILTDEVFCGLCTAALCLFLEPTAPEWATIHESERLRALAAKESAA